MRRRGFTLVELMAAVLLGSLVMLCIAGGLQAAIRSWESVQNRVGLNYNRRSVLDLVKRQSSSLFFRADADELDRAANPRGFGGANTNNRARNFAQRRLQAHTEANNPVVRQQTTGFVVPDGCSFFAGHVQELNFLSTVSFLSDFPGQVAVRYYVVQGNPEDGTSIADLPHSRSTQHDDEVEIDPDNPGFEDDVDELEGNLYLYIEEKNLFLAATMADEQADNDPFADVDAERDPEGEEGDDDGAQDDHNLRQNQDEHHADVSQVFATNSMKLIGPLRKFSVRYRKPGTVATSSADEEDDWAKSWDIDRVGSYPAAIEFTFVFEPPGDPDDTARIATEDLEGIRMVIPVYDAQNMIRGQRGDANGL